MAPKRTRAAAKAQELQEADSPLLQRLKRIQNAKVQEGPFQKLWTDIQEWAFEDRRLTQEAEKVRHSTIYAYANAPLMASFTGMKEAAVKFIISRYHNGRFYFDRPIDSTGDVISRLTGLSNQGSLVPIGIKEGLVQDLTGSPLGKNSKGLMIGQITTQMPKIVAKIITITLTLSGRGSDLKLEMLEAVDTIATDGRIYRRSDLPMGRLCC